MKISGMIFGASVRASALSLSQQASLKKKVSSLNTVLRARTGMPICPIANKEATGPTMSGVSQIISGAGLTHFALILKRLSTWMDRHMTEYSTGENAREMSSLNPKLQCSLLLQLPRTRCF